jgi:lysophospholipid acyltransferase (LPLAT)-like uncharacterized protein
MAFGSRIFGANWMQRTIGVVGAEYLRLVGKTSRFTVEPADFYQRTEPEQPVIIALWHGQILLSWFFVRKYRIKVLISRHRDGEIPAITAERLGVETIRGSGDHGGEFVRKGGVTAFKGMHGALAEGWNVALTADVPKVAQVAGLGIVRLASRSGRPIYPVGIAFSRKIVLNSWDRSEISLPFSHGTMVVGDPIRVSMSADQDALEAARAALEAGLNAATRRARAAVGPQT